MDIRLPQEFLQKLHLESPDLPKPLSRMSRRASLVSSKRVRGHQGRPSSPSLDTSVRVCLSGGRLQQFVGLWRHLLASANSQAYSPWSTSTPLGESHQG